MTEYEKYQLQWMISHGYSLKDLMSELTQMQYDDPEDSDRISTPISELFDEWVTDVGFGSEIWACEAEWKDCEGAEKSTACPYCEAEMNDFIMMNQSVEYSGIEMAVNRQGMLRARVYDSDGKMTSQDIV